MSVCVYLYDVSDVTTAITDAMILCVCCFYGSNRNSELQEQRRSFRFSQLLDVLAVPLGISGGSKIAQCNIQFDTGVLSEFRTAMLVDKKDTAA